MEKPSLNLPALIEAWDLDGAVEVLRTYYGARYPKAGDRQPRLPYTGAWFDEFDLIGTRFDHPDEFTADDLVSVSLLNTPIKRESAEALLYDGALRSKVSELLRKTRVSDCLWDVGVPLDSSWSLWELENLLIEKVKGVRYTRASKLIARKRPHLYPINDEVVRELIWPGGIPDGRSFVGAVHEVFQNKERRDFLARVRQEAGLPEAVPLLRIFDVLAWMPQK
ncbi:DUF6308 family protein [Corynebacterium variabile]|uniref:DUF6308 family protein n=1 Tax=Corynebacterium variabile TaxID=1727 RepID=UPI003A8F95F4